MAGLAVTLVERREGNKVINKWKPFHNVYNRTNTMSKYVFGAKCKEHFDDYERVLAKDGKAVKKVDLPIVTRVSAALRLFQGALCSMHSLKFFGMSNPTFYNLLLSPEQWQQLAEFEGIMRKVSNTFLLIINALLFRWLTVNWYTLTGF